MQYETLQYSLDEGIARITLNRPDQLNALNTQMRAELQYALTRAPKDNARVIVLTGAGRAFCSGQDLGGQGNAADIDLERLLRDEYQPILEALSRCPIPTIAAVNGAAAGAGCNIALAADVVVAAESAFFMQAFSRIGLIPDAGGTHFLPRSIGMAKSMGAALFADKITATEAERLGMIWEVAPDATFEQTWQSRARVLANGPTQAYKRIKDSIRATFENDLETQLDLEASLQGQCGKTRDFQEGITAFVEKRPANFDGT